MLKILILQLVFVVQELLASRHQVSGLFFIHPSGNGGFVQEGISSL